MGTLIITLAIVAFVTGYILPNQHIDAGGTHPLNGPKRALKVVGIVGVLVGFISQGYYAVPAGHRGVLLQFRAVNGVMDEGAHFVVPFVQSVELMEVRTQKEEAVASAASRDLQTVSARVAINYHLEPKAVGNLYKSVGPAFAQRIIDPATQETVKAVVANYTAEELVRLRSKVKAEIDEGLTQRLGNYSIVVEPGGVSLTNFDFSDEFNKAIERKQVAQQTAEQQKYELQKAQLQAQTAIATAEGEAKANRIRAEALEAHGGDKVLAQQWIEAWKAGGSQMPVVMGSEGGIMLNLESLRKMRDQKPQK